VAVDGRGEAPDVVDHEIARAGLDAARPTRVTGKRGS
jgi:hypothetical protein